MSLSWSTLGGRIRKESGNKQFRNAANDALAPYEADVCERKMGGIEANGLERSLYLLLTIKILREQGLRLEGYSV